MLEEVCLFLLFECVFGFFYELGIGDFDVVVRKKMDVVYVKFE